MRARRVARGVRRERGTHGERSRRDDAGSGARSGSGTWARARRAFDRVRAWETWCGMRGVASRRVRRWTSARGGVGAMGARRSEPGVTAREGRGERRADGRAALGDDANARRVRRARDRGARGRATDEDATVSMRIRRSGRGR